MLGPRPARCESHRMSHPFDDAVQLAWQGHDCFAGHTHPAWANMVGPYGGILAALAVRAVQQHPACLGEPVSLTLNYAAAVADGPLEITAQPVRTNRSTQHWALQLAQQVDGQRQVQLTATALTALKRDTWAAQDWPMPEVPAPEAVPPVDWGMRVQWPRRYDLRLLHGPIPAEQDGREADSLTQLWLRDEPPRALDFASLAAQCDAFYPRIWRRRARWVPSGTVSLTLYFHASAAELSEVGESHVFGQARAQDFRHGFFDQTAHLWSRSGRLLATAHQLVYYKE